MPDSLKCCDHEYATLRQPAHPTRPWAPRLIGSTSKHDIPHDGHPGMHGMPHHGHARLHQHTQLVLPVLLFSLLAPLASHPVS